MSEPTWERLDPRMLLLGPIGAVRGFLVPAVIAAVGFGNGDVKRGLVIGAIALVVSLVVGVLPWLTTTYRITSSALVVRTGVLQRKTLTAPLDRVRSVDLEAPLLHRLLRLRKVEVGTGVDDGAIELDSLGADAAETLHRRLLSLAPTSTGAAALAAAAAAPAPGGDDALAAAPAPEGDDAPVDDAASVDDAAPLDGPTPAASVAPEKVLATFDASWARFAPFSLGPLAIVGAVIGAATQFDLPFASTGAAVWDWLLRLSLLAVLLLLVGGGLFAWCALTMVGYLTQWWGLRLTREHGNLRLTRGLFTTATTTVEEARVRGVELKEPVLLRLVDGARLNALVTGLDDGVYGVLPQVPSSVARGVAGDILRPDPQAPLTLTFRPHGPAAHRRALLRGVRHWATPVAIAAAALWGFDRLSWPWAIVACVAAVAWGFFTGAQSYRNLGHALTAEHLVVGAASLTRTRTVLERDGVIGWVLEATWFQRRVGLVNLTATTAAGSESVALVDVPRAEAEAVVRALTPAWA